MPIELERALQKAAAKHGFTGKKKDAYVHGTLNKKKKKGKKKGRPTDMGKVKDVE